jgi:hypothetical protein
MCAVLVTVLILQVVANTLINQRIFKMKRLLLFLILVSVCGCASTTQKTIKLRHETSESKLLTEAEFMGRVSQSATQIYEGFRAIDSAARLYASENGGNFPAGSRQEAKSKLLGGGYLNEWPVVPEFAFTDPTQYEIKYHSQYADADDNGKTDHSIYVQDLKLEVCDEFVRNYGSPGYGDTIYDFEAAGGKYPGQTIGRHIKIYAISWEKVLRPEYCDILWVVQYTGFPDE